MYIGKYGLSTRPFSLAPDPSMIVWTSGLKDVRENVRASVLRRDPVIVVSGVVGAGKSTFLFALINDLAASAGLKIVLMRSAFDDADDMLTAVADEMDKGHRLSGGPLERIAVAAEQNPLLLILDEAQYASPRAVMALYGLAVDQGGLTLLLSGQPEMRKRLSGPEYSAIDIPKGNLHHLASLSEADAQSYIATRLERAGAAPELISSDAAAAIARAAGYVPRKINKVAEACLFLASLEERPGVDSAFVKRVVSENLDPQTLALRIVTGASLASVASELGAGSDTRLDEEVTGDASSLTGDGELRSKAVDSHVQRAIVSASDPPSDFTATAQSVAPSGGAKKRRVPRGGLWLVAGVAVLAAPALVFVLSESESDRKLAGAPVQVSENASVAAISTEPALQLGSGGTDTATTDEVTAPPGSEEKLDGPVLWPVEVQAPMLTITELATPAPLYDAPPSMGAWKDQSLSIGTMTALAPAGGSLHPARLASRTVRELAVNAIPQRANQSAVEFYERALSRNDPERAAIDYARAAILGHSRSALYLGQQFETGDGVSFSPGMAARWYAVSEGRDPDGAAPSDGAAKAEPLFSAWTKDSLDLVWDGAGGSFSVELADADYRPIAFFETDLTAASVTAPNGIGFWRVRSGTGAYSDWTPIPPE